MFTDADEDTPCILKELDIEKNPKNWLLLETWIMSIKETF